MVSTLVTHSNLPLVYIFTLRYVVEYLSYIYILNLHSQLTVSYLYTNYRARSVQVRRVDTCMKPTHSNLPLVYHTYIKPPLSNLPLVYHTYIKPTLW